MKTLSTNHICNKSNFDGFVVRSMTDHLQIGTFQSHSPIPKSPFFVKVKSGAGESWDLFSNQQMGLEVQKNLSVFT